MRWPESFYAMRGGEGCPMCAEGRPEENVVGVRIFAGKVSDAYLRGPTFTWLHDLDVAGTACR